MYVTSCALVRKSRKAGGSGVHGLITGEKNPLKRITKLNGSFYQRVVWAYALRNVGSMAGYIQ